MKVLYFGTYSKGPGYPRNTAIIKGLRANGITVIECNREIFSSADEKALAVKSPFAVFRLLVRMSAIYCSLIGKFLGAGNYDVIVVGYLGHFDIFLAKILNLLNLRKPVVLDAFLSLFDSVVHDRKLVTKNSLRGRLLWHIDKYACSVSDFVLLDTLQHIEYFSKEFALPSDRFIRVFVGDDERNIPDPQCERPLEYNRPFNVLFFGTYLPLHGIPYIIEAARLLEADREISFTLLGNGPDYPKIRDIASAWQLKNTHFINKWTDETELLAYIQHASVCLGIFGETSKAGRVVPCKVFNCLRQGKPLITGDTPGARELLENGKSACLCKPANARSIADAISRLKRKTALRTDMGKNALHTYNMHGSPEAIGRTLSSELRKRVL